MLKSPKHLHVREQLEPVLYENFDYHVCFCSGRSLQYLQSIDGHSRRNIEKLFSACKEVDVIGRK